MSFYDDAKILARINSEKYSRFTPRQRQARFRKLVKKTVQVVSLLIVMIVIGRFTYYWGFEKPNTRDLEVNGQMIWQDQDVETKTNP